MNGVLIGGPQDGYEFTVFTRAREENGVDAGVRWRDQGWWLFFTEFCDTRYYVHESYDLDPWLKALCD